MKNEGWICPKCCSVMAPNIPSCLNCKPTINVIQQNNNHPYGCQCSSCVATRYSVANSGTSALLMAAKTFESSVWKTITTKKVVEKLKDMAREAEIKTDESTTMAKDGGNNA